jgi:transposase
MPYKQVAVASQTMMAAQGIDNDEIAARPNTHREVVSQWRKRFFKDRSTGLDERARPGRPRVHPPQFSVVLLLITSA